MVHFKSVFIQCTFLPFLEILFTVISVSLIMCLFMKSCNSVLVSTGSDFFSTGHGMHVFWGVENVGGVYPFGYSFSNILSGSACFRP